MDYGAIYFCKHSPYSFAKTIEFVYLVLQGGPSTRVGVVGETYIGVVSSEQMSSIVIL